MKSTYNAPDLVVIKLTLKDVILSSPIEGSIPDQGATLPPDPNELSELPDELP